VPSRGNDVWMRLHFAAYDVHLRPLMDTTLRLIRCNRFGISLKSFPKTDIFPRHPNSIPRNDNKFPNVTQFETTHLM